MSLNEAEETTNTLHDDYLPIVIDDDSGLVKGCFGDRKSQYSMINAYFNGLFGAISFDAIDTCFVALESSIKIHFNFNCALIYLFGKNAFDEACKLSQTMEITSSNNKDKNNNSKTLFAARFTTVEKDVKKDYHKITRVWNRLIENVCKDNEYISINNDKSSNSNNNNNNNNEQRNTIDVLQIPVPST